MVVAVVLILSAVLLWGLRGLGMALGGWLGEWVDFLLFPAGRRPTP